MVKKFNFPFMTKKMYKIFLDMRPSYNTSRKKSLQRRVRKKKKGPSSKQSTLRHKI